MIFGACWLNLFADLLHFLVPSLRSKNFVGRRESLPAQTARFYQERKIRPRRLDNPTRLTLLWLSRWFDWRNALGRADS
jgi:hypothetical protein